MSKIIKIKVFKKKQLICIFIFIKSFRFVFKNIKNSFKIFYPFFLTPYISD